MGWTDLDTYFAVGIGVLMCCGLGIQLYCKYKGWL